MGIVRPILIILTITILLVAGIFLPFVHGDYDHFAVGISTTIQFAAFASLLLIPIGLIWRVLDLIKGKATSHPVLFKVALGVVVIIIIAAALGAFVSQNRSSSIIILLAGPLIFISFKKVTESKSIPYYFIFIPLIVISNRLAWFEMLKNQNIAYVIERSEELIQDLESYKKRNGHYPLSIQSTIEDYRTNVSGIDRFHYEQKGDAYNLYFKQFSEMLGTEEIVMYNKLDEHEMTVHNQDLLRIPDSQIIRGYHQVVKLPQHHWKIFYFD